MNAEIESIRAEIEKAALMQLAVAPPLVLDRDHVCRVCKGKGRLDGIGRCWCCGGARWRVAFLSELA